MLTKTLSLQQILKSHRKNQNCSTLHTTDNLERSASVEDQSTAQKGMYKDSFVTSVQAFPGQLQSVSLIKFEPLNEI